MADARSYDEEQLSDLLALLRPAPADWVQCAQELPFARAEIDTIVRLAEEDVAFRERLRNDVEHALREAGFEPDSALVDAVRARIDDASPDEAGG
jgi:hypothetical protein